MRVKLLTFVIDTIDFINDLEDIYHIDLDWLVINAIAYFIL